MFHDWLVPARATPDAPLVDAPLELLADKMRGFSVVCAFLLRAHKGVWPSPPVHARGGWSVSVSGRRVAASGGERG